MWGNFSKINRSQDILTFRDFAIWKIVLHSKIINKMQTNKKKLIIFHKLFWRQLSGKSFREISAS